MVAAAIVGGWGLHTYPVQINNPFLALIALEKPFAFAVLSYGYATLSEISAAIGRLQQFFRKGDARR